MSVLADVVVFGAQTEDVVERCQSILAGVDVRARVASVRAIQSGSSWLIVMSLPLRPLYEQLRDDHSKGGSPGPRRLADTFRALADDPGTAIAGMLLLQDTETGIEVVIQHGLPEGAFSALEVVDLADYTFGPLDYDASVSDWRSVMDHWDLRRGRGADSLIPRHDVPDPGV